jgi:4-hydroxymandelate oxidase
MRPVGEPLNLDDFEAIARERLDPGVYGYYSGGAEDEVTVRANREAFRELALRYRVLVDVSRIDTSTRLLGTPLRAPFVVAPLALQKMAHPDGERATARAACSAGALMTLSTASSITLEEVAGEAAEAPRWFQLYCYADHALTERLIHRAEGAGYRAVVLTVDAPVLGRRERDLRTPFVLPEGIRPAHLDAPPATSDGTSVLKAVVTEPATAWADLAWIRSLSSLPLLLKGIVRGDDAVRAVEAGVDGIWVSNHGGRQLDTSIPTAHALPEVVEAVARRIPVIVDGGIRRGTDVVKAIALGASAVALGRPVLWGLVAGGESGVAAVLGMLREELARAMALCGVRSLSEIDRDLVAASQ